MHKLFRLFFIILLAFFLFGYLHSIKIIDYIDMKIYDFIALEVYKTQKCNANNDASSNVVIVDIDTKSLKALGLSTWPRVVHAQLIQTIDEMKPAIIGLDINFKYKDKSSPQFMEHFYGKFFNMDAFLSNVPHELKDNDKVLAKIIDESATVLSVDSALENKNNSHLCMKDFSLNLKLKDSIVAPISSKLNCNIQELHQFHPAFGYNDIPIDNDGVVRNLYLYKKYNNIPIPSLGLATLLNLHIHDYNSSTQTLNFLGHTLALQSQTKRLLNFNQPKIKVFSAIDILSDTIGNDSLHGKIVIISSSEEERQFYQTYMDESSSSSMLWATFIDNTLNGSFIHQDNLFKWFSLYLASLSLLIIALLWLKRKYLFVALFTFLLVFGSYIWAYKALEQYQYISLAYLWIVIIIFLLLLPLYLFIDNKDNTIKLKRDLNNAYLSSVASMALVASTHDVETGQHLIRTKKYIKALAKKLYEKRLYKEIIDKHYIDLLYEASPLHDIGKVGIADSILKKPDKLTFDEFEIMKTHAQLGGNILKESLSHYEHNPLLEVAFNIAMYHHEKWDGSGYPKGLKGDEIPLEAQLMSIADIYDALISKRRYKRSFTYEEAEQIIIQESGKAFNPLLVDIFRELSSKFKEISLEWVDE